LEKFEGLKDGSSVLLRELTMDDFDSSLAFLKALPATDRRYLRVDVTRKEIVERRLKQAAAGDVYRIAAFVDDVIVADGALETSGHDWSRHIGEIRVLVAEDYRSLRLGTILIGELFLEAERQMVEKVIVKMAEQQIAVRKICDRLGFRVDAVLPDHFKDAEGMVGNLVVMSCTLDAMWREMRDLYPKDDWPDG
jgi:GNAT superfamily N-acetyltransferase